MIDVITTIQYCQYMKKPHVLTMVFLLGCLQAGIVALATCHDASAVVCAGLFGAGALGLWTTK
jgi:hypothetical protein